MTINQVIKYFGTKAEVARVLKIKPSAVSHWVRDNEVPPARQLQIQKITKGKLKAGL
ncbi:Cro/CI family transcriptional regulator [Francisella philomiragia]|uniref:Cro/CI family transcriptional regulator n=1 Tax=Francisella philomiragia TaxID=28110 RepID=UPI001C9D9FB3|nr:Cro/CI family transcriptional regulator [Francisella philomiragia]MBY7733461.1 Cro/Cl family transcriptional regulator [Francisella philomiragia]